MITYPVCMCVCVCACAHTHTHTHTQGYIYYIYCLKGTLVFDEFVDIINATLDLPVTSVNKKKQTFTMLYIERGYYICNYFSNQ